VTSEYEAWVIHWARGGEIELHDHGGSNGAVAVVRGELTETYTSAPGRPLRTRFLGAPSAITFGPTHVHDLVNHGPTMATTIHVYTPHLASMTYYDRRLQPLRTESLVLGQHVG
jgi:predicted metal-dependent enzyme (double-stranded beta helix superfamily)